MARLHTTLYWSNKKENLGSKQLFLKRHISAQNEESSYFHVFKFFWGHMPRHSQQGDACGITSNSLAIQNLTLCQQINWRALTVISNPFLFIILNIMLGNEETLQKIPKEKVSGIL